MTDPRLATQAARHSVVPTPSGDASLAPATFQHRSRPPDLLETFAATYLSGWEASDDDGTEAHPELYFVNDDGLVEVTESGVYLIIASLLVEITGAHPAGVTAVPYDGYIATNLDDKGPGYFSTCAGVVQLIEGESSSFGGSSTSCMGLLDAGDTTTLHVDTPSRPLYNGEDGSVIWRANLQIVRLG